MRSLHPPKRAFFIILLAAILLVLPILPTNALPRGAQTLPGIALAEADIDTSEENADSAGADEADSGTSAGAAAANTAASGGTVVYNTIDDLSNSTRFAILTGTCFKQMIQEYYPDATFIEFNTYADELAALGSDRVDAVPNDEPATTLAAAENPEFKVMEGMLLAEDYYYATAKTDAGIALAKDFNAWLAEAREQGVLEELKEFWCGTASPEGRITTADLTGENGTLRVGISSNLGRPGSFVYEGAYAGYCVDMMVRYCRSRGYGIEFIDLNMSAFAAALKTGKLDIYCNFMSYTEERAESMYYTDPIYSGGVTFLVRDTEYVKKTTLWDTISEGFTKTFIREDRWRLILSGLGVTMLITFGGFALANLLGALFCAMGMSKHRSVRILADIYSRIMQGTPMVVVLMILYYVVFSKSKISGVPVAILGFGLAEGAVLAQSFRGAISAVDKGQREAALALGFNRLSTFTGIVLPQAIRTALPGYFSELIALMKGTAVVGYIAVVDLTKVSDIIRSSTFEAFFPLLAIAVIYFIIAFLLLSILKRIRRGLAPKRVTGKEDGK